MVIIDPVIASPIVVRSDAGKIHIRYQIDGRTVDDGRCGIDDNWTRVTLEQVEEHDIDRLCRFCFPDTAGD